jgi:hypothetical protein
MYKRSPSGKKSQDLFQIVLYLKETFEKYIFILQIAKRISSGNFIICRFVLILVSMYLRILIRHFS